MPLDAAAPSRFMLTRRPWSGRVSQPVAQAVDHDPGLVAPDRLDGGGELQGFPLIRGLGPRVLHREALAQLAPQLEPDLPVFIVVKDHVAEGAQVHGRLAVARMDTGAGREIGRSAGAEGGTG